MIELGLELRAPNSSVNFSSRLSLFTQTHVLARTHLGEGKDLDTQGGDYLSVSQCSDPWKGWV